jgi:hypothetical protein
LLTINCDVQCCRRKQIGRAHVMMRFENQLKPFNVAGSELIRVHAK